MMTALQALKLHRENFWRAQNCNAWMATESQLIAYNARQRGNGSQGSLDQISFHDGYARHIMGVKEEDQFYA